MSANALAKLMNSVGTAVDNVRLVTLEEAPMFRPRTNEWAVLKDQFVALRHEEPDTSIEAVLDDHIRRRFGHYIMRAALPEYEGRGVLPRRAHARLPARQ